MRHCVGINFARCKSFSSSSLDHSIFRMPGSNHSDHLALHCFGVFRARSDETRAHWFKPYLETEALRISSSMLVHTPPLTTGIVVTSLKNTCCQISHRRKHKTRRVSNRMKHALTFFGGCSRQKLATDASENFLGSASWRLWGEQLF